MSTVTALLPSSLRLFLRRKRAQTERTARNLAVKFGPSELFFNQCKPLSKSDAFDYRTLFPAKLMSFEGRYLDYLKASKWFNEGTYNRTEAFTCNLQNVRLHVGSGVLADSDNVLIDDSALEHGRLTEMPVYGARVPSRYTHIGRATTIWHGWANNYYHWLIDCMSRLYALKDVGETQLLMPGGLKPYQRRSLALAMPENLTLVELHGNSWTKCDSFAFPSFVTWKANGYLPGPSADYLRETVFSRLGLTENRPSKRIYVSRTRAKNRRIANEADLRDLLIERGFEVAILEEMPFEDQVRLFHSAEIVIGPHGAGFSNMLWAGKTATLVDLLPCRSPATHFFFLTKSLGQRYEYLLHDEQSDNADFEVDLAGLKRVLGTLNI